MKVEKYNAKVFVGMIAKEDIKTMCVMGLRDAGLISELFICRRSPPDNARNKVIEAFLKTDCTHLLFVDSDVVVPPNILDLLKYDKKVIAPLSFGLLNNKTIVPMVFSKHPDGLNFVPLQDIYDVELYGAYASGCSWMIHREVFEKCVDADGMWHKQTWRDTNGKIRFGEDIYFFEQIKKHGYYLYIARDIRTSHVKYMNVTE